MPRGRGRGGGGGGGGGRGKGRGHKGGHRHFTNLEEVENQQDKERKEMDWRKRQGLLPSSDEESESGSEDEDDPYGELEDGKEKNKGVEHLIDTYNPNHVKARTKKVTALETEGGPAAAGGATGGAPGGGGAAGGGGGGNAQLSRKEKEELAAQASKERYQKLHAQGKTDEARADMARLALIRKQREDAAKKREEEKLVQDQKKKEAEQKLLDKRAAAQGKK